ncbi:MAG: hypothetical protein ACOYLX_20805 [Burkholderiaceae bacterium]
MRTMWLALIAVFTAATLTLGANVAEAKRVGSGKNVGKQAPNSMTRDAAPQTPSSPPASQAAPGAAGGPAAAPAAAAAPSAAAAARPGAAAPGGARCRAG